MDFMRFFWTALGAVLLTLAGLVVVRTALDFTRVGDQVVQRSCGQDLLQDYCVERHVLPAIPLLREERRTVEVYAGNNPARYLSVGDPFIADVTIGWTDTAATLTDSTGFALVLDEKFLAGLQS